MANIRELMEQWVRWRQYRHGGIGKTMLQRCMDGMPGTHCPTCGGGGRMPGRLIGRPSVRLPCPTCGGSGRARLYINHHRVRRRRCPDCMVKGISQGETNGRTCIRCRGSGWRVEEFDKSNPAFISSTYLEPDKPALQRIDRLVCELRRRSEHGVRHTLLSYWLVIDAEYCDHRGGTQEIKANRMGISYESYKKRLQRALEWIAASLPDRRDCRVIPFPYSDKSLPLDMDVTKR